jgi:hypothetical protein
MTAGRLSFNLLGTRKGATVSNLIPIGSHLIRDRMETALGKERATRNRTRRRAPRR